MEDARSIRELVFHIGACAERMTINAFQDIQRCIHFVDHCEEDCEVVWDNVYLDGSIKATDGTANNCMEFAMVEEVFNVH